MKLPDYAWIHITPIKPWKLILPYHKSKINSKSSIPLLFGHYNQNYHTNLQKKYNVDIKGAYPIRLMRINNLQYKVGPLVGILTTEGNRQFRGNKQNFKDLIKTGIKTGVLVYVFPVESINPLTKEAKAYLYLPTQNKWITRMMPLPDVVYNRIPSRKEEDKPVVKQTIQFLKNENIPFFNLRFFNKWTLYQWMKESSELTKIVPETTFLSQENLREALKKYPMFYLKPINGKAGVGFMKIERTNSSILLTYQTHQKQYRQEFKQFSALWKFISSLTKHTEYIIQRGVNLTTFQGRPYDLRILVQKNGLGNWAVTGIGIRQAGEKSITTHVPRGGSILSFQQVMESSFGPNIAQELKKKLSALAIKIAKHLERKSGHMLGEISLDIGIDQHYRLWFFEANAKPMEFDEPAIRETSLLRLMQYFRYLSGFVPKEVVS